MNLITALIFLSQFGFAQSYQNNDFSHPSMDNLSQEGQLVSIRFVIGEPIKIFVVGKEEAKLDLTQLKLFVRRLSPHPERPLGVIQHSSYFTLSENIGTETPTELEVKATVKGKEETFRVRIKGKKKK